MKILVYAEPTTIFAGPHPMAPVLRDHLYRWLTKDLLNRKDVEIKTIVPELAFLQNRTLHLIDELHPICFSDENLQRVFPNAHSIQEMFLKIFNNELSEKEHRAFQQIISSLLPNAWQPDIVIDFQIHNELLKKAFPQALHFLMENGIFSRPPFCRSLRYDPIHFLNGFPNRFESKIRSFPIISKQKAALLQFKKELRELINFYNPLKKQLQDLRKNFKYVLLCPVPSDNIYKETTFDDQYLYLLNILQQIPNNVALITTFHDGIDSQLNSAVINTLKQKYPNLFYFPVENNSYVSQSLNFFEYCDAIINMHTMTGTQALLWDLKIISLDKRYSKWFCDKQGLDNLEEFLAAPKVDKDGLIYWYLTHFSVFEKNFNTPNWYYTYFKRKLEKFKKDGITFDLFEQVEDFDELSAYILAYVKKFYRKKASRSWRHKIYFHYKTDTERVYSFFGKPFKFKRKN